jgi:hypothetical protein
VALVVYLIASAGSGNSANRLAREVSTDEAYKCINKAARSL